MWGATPSSGIAPYKKIVARGKAITVEEDGARQRCEGDVFAELKGGAGAGHTPAQLPGLPPFTAGAVGFFAYDVVRQIRCGCPPRRRMSWVFPMHA